MRKKAVIDIGSLKTKVSVFDVDSRKLLKNTSHVTLLGKLDQTKQLQEDSLKLLQSVLTEVAVSFKKDTIEDVIIIGTEALRTAANKQRVHDIVAEFWQEQPLQIIDQATEGRLFFTAVSREFPDQPIAAIDIGGGSTQLLYGHYDSKLNKPTIAAQHNFATGTYRLKQHFSPDENKIYADLNNITQHIRSEFASITCQSPILVFGSTCMQDFIRATRVPTITEEHVTHPFYVTNETLSGLLDELRHLPANQRDHYYSGSQYFMYGADHLLLNILEAAKILGATKLYPTNLNSAYGLI